MGTATRFYLEYGVITTEKHCFVAYYQALIVLLHCYQGLAYTVNRQRILRELNVSYCLSQRESFSPTFLLHRKQLLIYWP